MSRTRGHRRRSKRTSVGWKARQPYVEPVDVEPVDYGMAAAFADLVRGGGDYVYRQRGAWFVGRYDRRPPDAGIQERPSSWWGYDDGDVYDEDLWDE